MKLIFIFLLSFLSTAVMSTGRMNIAVMELDGNNVPVEDLGTFSNRLRTELFNTGNFSVIERSRMNEILKEQGFQQTGCTSTECAIEAGQLIGVSKIIVGSVDKIGMLYSANIRMVDVTTGKIELIADETCERCGVEEVFKTTISNVAIKIAGGTPSQPSVPQHKIQNISKNELDNMILIPSGSFAMGGNKYPEEKPIHRVEIRSFWLDKFEVTQKEFEETMQSNPSNFKNCPNCPVERVRWDEANAYCIRRGKRLPTEAEWEYAARAGSVSEYYWVTSDPDPYAWYEKNSNGNVHQVGLKKPNAFGLYDMAGNVREWCNDYYQKRYFSSPSDNPKGPDNGDERVQRGGSYDEETDYLRSARRTERETKERTEYVGFRCARDK